MTAPKESRKKTLQPCFYLGNDMYVPHLENPGFWVTYGGKKLKSLQELLTLRAKVSHEKLFVQEAPNDWVSKIRVI
jgi:hypothetical protein